MGSSWAYYIHGVPNVIMSEGVILKKHAKKISEKASQENFRKGIPRKVQKGHAKESSERPCQANFRKGIPSKFQNGHAKSKTEEACQDCYLTRSISQLPGRNMLLVDIWVWLELQISKRQAPVSRLTSFSILHLVKIKPVSEGLTCCEPVLRA